MKKLIDAQTAYDVLTDYYHHTTDIQHETLMDALSRVPTVDAVPVVRCKDCKHNPLDTWFDCPIAHLKYDGDRWCWKGERKDGDNHD